MKTAELTGALLDYWVARAEGLPVYAAGTDTWPGNGAVHREAFEHAVITIGLEGLPAGVFIEYMGDSTRYAPSTDWAQGGPLVEKYQVEMRAYGPDNWHSRCPSEYYERVRGTSALQAICRAVVRAKFGDEVADIPAPTGA